MTNQERFTLRIDTELMDKIRQRAARQGVSLNVCILDMLDESINRRNNDVLRMYSDVQSSPSVSPSAPIPDDDNDISDSYFSYNFFIQSDSISDQDIFYLGTDGQWKKMIVK